MKLFSHYATGLEKSFDYKGRSSLSEFWLFHLMNFLVIIALAVIQGLLGPIAKPLLLLYQFAMIFPMISLHVRRVHDCGKAWYWGLVPIYNTSFFFTPSQDGANQWGPNPKDRS